MVLNHYEWAKRTNSLLAVVYFVFTLVKQIMTNVHTGNNCARTGISLSVVIFNKLIGSVLVNDMQTLPSPSSLSKRTVFIFWYKITRNVLKQIENQFLDFCDFFRYSRLIKNVFSFRYSRFLHPKKCFIFPKDEQYSETNFLVLEFFFWVIFSFWDMVDFVFNIPSELDVHNIPSEHS